MLKADVGPGLAGSPPGSPSATPLPPAMLKGKYFSDDDLWVLVPETPFPSAMPVTSNTGSMEPLAATSLRDPLFLVHLWCKEVLACWVLLHFWQVQSVLVRLLSVGQANPVLANTLTCIVFHSQRVELMSGPSRAVSNIQSAFHRPLY